MYTGDPLDVLVVCSQDFQGYLSRLLYQLLDLFVDVLDGLRLVKIGQVLLSDDLEQCLVGVVGV